MPDVHTHEILLRGRFSSRLLGPFIDDFTQSCDEAGVTRLLGNVRDPSHLNGLVAYLASINAELISITPIPSNPPQAPPTTPTSQQQGANS